jgi:hypothetical protein
MLALMGADGVCGHRIATLSSGVGPGMFWCDFNETIRGALQKLRVGVFIWRDLQVRLAFVLPSLPVRALEAPGALGCERAADVIRRSEPAMGWEYAEVMGRALAIQRLWGFDAQQTSAPFLGYSNINVAYPYVEQPLVCEARPSVEARGFASVSLLRPGPFDPAQEFRNISVTAFPNGSFRVFLPEGDSIYSALGFDLPTRVELNDFIFYGPGLRCLQVKTNGSEIAGLNLTQVANVVDSTSPGTIRLKRAGNTTHLTTDVGVSLASGWLGGRLRSVEVQILSGEWLDVTAACGENDIPAKVVSEWSHRNNRTLADFRVRV